MLIALYANVGRILTLQVWYYSVDITVFVFSLPLYGADVKKGRQKHLEPEKYGIIEQ